MITIITPVGASAVEKNAAAELCLWLGKAFDDDFEISEEVKKGEIYVGHTAFAAAHGVKAGSGWDKRSAEEAWIMRETEGKLVLTGGVKNTDRGVIYAVEHYLEDVAGVRFWNAIEEYVPRNGRFSVPAHLDVCGTPKADMRFPVAVSWIGDDVKFCVRRRSNQLDIPDEWGGGVNCSKRGRCHTVATIFPPDGLFEKHPDWFAWNEKEGRRLPYGQYCLNNEEFCAAWEKAFLDDIRALYDECDRKGESRPHHMHISLSDDSFDCECPACRERRKKSGQTGNFLRFANRMAEAAEREFPGTLVEILVYLTYMELPLDDTVPAKNIIVRLADLSIDILHDLDHPNNAHCLDVLRGWSKLCEKNGNTLAVWDYNINVRMSGPVNNTYRLPALVKTYEDHGVKGYFMEHEEPLLSDFWCLKNWLLCHLFEDPGCDCDKLTDDFVGFYYGPAASAIKEYLKLMDGIAEKSEISMICVENFCKVDHLPYEAYIEGHRIMEEAEKAAGTDGVILRRVRQARASLDLASAERYTMLLQAAARRGETLPFTYEECILRYQLIVNETWVQTEEYRMKNGLPERQTWEGIVPALTLRHPYIPGELPEELRGKRVLEIPLYDFITQVAEQLGLVYVEDADSPAGRAVRSQNDKMPEWVRDMAVCRPKDDPAGTLAFRLRHNGKFYERKLSLEDMKPGRYSLYKAFDIDGLSEGSNTLLTIAKYQIAPHMSGFAHFLGSKNVTVWISMKPTGKAYGGDKNDVDALWFDRMFIEERPE